jgi:hypothetical protein
MSDVAFSEGGQACLPERHQELEFWQERSRILKQRQKVAKGESPAPAEESLESKPDNGRPH